MPVLPAAYLPLLKTLLTTTLLLQWLWAAVIVGGVLFSLLVFLLAQRYQDPLRLHSVREILTRTLPCELLGLLFWLLALLNLVAVSSIYRPPFFTPPFWGGALALLASALLLLFFYRQLINRQQPDTFLTLTVGAAGLGMLLGVLLLLTCGGAALLKPEYWPHLAHNPLHFLSWNGLARLLLFLALALLLTGVVLLRSNHIEPAEQASNVRAYLGRRGEILALFGGLLLPLGLLFELLTQPIIARTLIGFLLSAISLILTLLLCLRLCQRLVEGQSRADRQLLAVVVAIFVVVNVGDYLTREQVWAGGTALWQEMSPVPQAEKTTTVPAQELVSRGEQVFQERCAVCHRFDTRLVGPSLLEVLPNYRGRVEALQQFIREPVKRNPDYPAMPNLGLQQEEAAAVAAYLLDQLEQQ